MTLQNAPVILVPPEEGFDPLMGSAHIIISQRFSQGVSAAGGLPLTPADWRCIDDYADTAQGLFLAEGPPVHRGRYKKYYAEMSALQGLQPGRDDLEFGLLMAFAERKKPVLGLGRGFDVIVAAFGGSIDPDAAKEGDTTKRPVKISPFLFCLEEEGGLEPVSPPARQVESTGPYLEAVAASEDGVIEAVKHRELPIYGVAWHDEWEMALLGRLLVWFAGLMALPAAREEN
jgi:gamma-glutamyl-gamma-aminobutyrate hydrolase PuuD